MSKQTTDSTQLIKSIPFRGKLFSAMENNVFAATKSVYSINESKCVFTPSLMSSFKQNVSNFHLEL